MPISYPAILELKSEPETVVWKDKDAMLYALGIGLGSDPLNAEELPFVYENGLKAVPTLATVLTMTAGYSRLMAQSGINFARVVHGEQAVELHRPLPPEGEAAISHRVAAVYDKGEKGAILIVETSMTGKDGDALATLRWAIFARADGGFGGGSEAEAAPHPIPGRPADLSIDIPTRPDQALLYRLNGDRNPLHADPAFAKMVGFPRPILHGLCTFGITCRAVLQAYTDFDPARIKAHQARFSAPVFPGETVTVDLWRDGDTVSFEARVKDRQAVVIKNGKSVLA
ncbi:MAG TPA: MaoC/PaaZ C-terminal domain-containing protein [Roseiarcus sp.]